MQKSEHCETLEQLAVMFSTKFSVLRMTMELKDAADDQECRNIMENINNTLGDLEVLLALMRTSLRKQKESVMSVEQMKELTKLLQAKINHASLNLPVRLPKKSTSQNTQDNGFTSAVKHEKSSHTSKARHTPVAFESRVADVKKRPSAPTLEYLTVEEFQAVPKYMKGRISYEQINSTIDEFNKAMTGKYKVMTTARSAQNQQTKKKIANYKAQENKDTKGLHFVTESDIKEMSLLKLDRVGHSLMTILRHCGRLREIRGGGLTRFTVCV